jgi:hypothetical protein
LFTQGAVKASAAGGVLATVNVCCATPPGNLIKLNSTLQAGSNTVSMFSIDPADPININMIGKPMPSGGEFPVSLAFNKAGTQLCALNGGKVNGVR